MPRIEDDPQASRSEIEEELGAIDEVELREAEELARALSRGASGATEETPRAAPGGDAASVADMLEVSALLRVRNQLELSPTRQRAIFEELEKAHARKRRAPEERRPVFRWWWLLTLPLPVAGIAVLLFFVTTRPNGLARHDGTSGEAASGKARLALPEPPPSLLAAQARAISGTLSPETSGAAALRATESLALADYDRELGEYRGRWLSALHDQYRP